MPTFLETFKENPIWIFCAFVLGFFALVCLIPGFITLKKNPSLAMIFGGAVIGVGLMTMGAGIHGSSREHQRRDETLQSEGLTDADKQRIAVNDNAMAHWNLIAGLGAAALPIILGGVLIVVASGKKRRVT